METKLNRKINSKLFFELIKYLTKITTRLEINYCEPIYREPHNQFIVSIYCKQERLNSDYIFENFGVHVAKWSNVLSEDGFCKPNNNFEVSSVLIEID